MPNRFIEDNPMGMIVISIPVAKFNENHDENGRFASSEGSGAEHTKFQRFATGNNIAARHEEIKPPEVLATPPKEMENHTSKMDHKSGATVAQTEELHPKVERHRNRARNYKSHLPRECANPNCHTDPMRIEHFEIHHITPLSASGLDKSSNMIQLCPDCHRSGDLHSNWQGHVKELTSWKHAQDRKGR